MLVFAHPFGNGLVLRRQRHAARHQQAAAGRGRKAVDVVDAADAADDPILLTVDDQDLVGATDRHVHHGRGERRTGKTERHDGYKKSRYVTIHV